LGDGEDKSVEDAERTGSWRDEKRKKRYLCVARHVGLEDDLADLTEGSNSQQVHPYIFWNSTIIYNL